MTQHRSTRQPPRRRERSSSFRFLVTTLVTTTMVATGGFGALPNNPVTQTFQEEIGENVPKPLLDPINSYLEELSAPTIPPQPTSQPNPPLDIVGLILGDITSEPAVPVAVDVTATEILDVTSTLTETLTATETTTITSTPTLTHTSTSTLTATSTNTATSTPTRTSTPTSTITPTPTVTPRCSAPSTSFVNTTFFNDSAQTIDIYWRDFSCNLVFYNTLGPEESYVQGTYIGHLWEFRDASTTALIADYVVSAANQVVDVSTGTTRIATATAAPTDTAAPSTGFNVSAVSLDGSGSVVTVPSGQPVSVTYNYQVYSGGCTTCITQLVTGLGFSGSQSESCAYHGVPGAPPGDTGSENTVLVAPSTPGTYNVTVEFHWQFTCADAVANYGVGPAIAPQVIGQIIVP